MKSDFFSKFKFFRNSKILKKKLWNPISFSFSAISSASERRATSNRSFAERFSVARAAETASNAAGRSVDESEQSLEEQKIYRIWKRRSFEPNRRAPKIETRCRAAACRLASRKVLYFVHYSIIRYKIVKNIRVHKLFNLCKKMGHIRDLISQLRWGETGFSDRIYIKGRKILEINYSR